jgi:3-mercaptopyruvate sulfurtransferase SseA
VVEIEAVVHGILVRLEVDVRSLISITFALTFLVTGQAVAQNAGPVTPSPVPVQSVPADGARRISVEDAREAIEKGTAVVVDVRDEQSFSFGHIKGALSIPSSEIEKHLAELPHDKLIITYCS